MAVNKYQKRWAEPAFGLIQQSTAWYKPEVYKITCGKNVFIVKDYSQRASLLRKIFARWMIKRETKILSRLSGLNGFPQYVGTHGDLGLVMTLCDGCVLNSNFLAKNSALINQLEVYVRNLAAHGVVHNDLRLKNMIYNTNEKLFLIDFGAAFMLPTTKGLLHWITSPVFNFLLKMNELKVLRLKVNYAPSTLSSDDLDKLNGHTLKVVTGLKQFWKSHGLPLVKRIAW